ncbi:MAG: hypothetical protein M3347_03890, partial [Armatimonadota bacterium]|nr:hypothetical protein [Armatimonadota bacterium]
MHWLLILALLSSTTSLKDNQSGASLNRLAENSLRQQLGGANMVRVDIARGGKWQPGDFDRFNVTLDGFAADRLLNLANQVEAQGAPRNDSSRDRYPDIMGDNDTWRSRNNFDLGDIFGDGTGEAGDFGDLGGILGGILGSKSGGRIGSIQINATNFTFQGTRYDSLSASLGEIKFDWTKALRGEFDIKSVQPGSLRLGLRADQLQRLVAPRMPSVRDLRLRFANGRAFVGGRTDLYGMRIPFEVGGRLSIRTNQVFADDIGISVARLRLPSFVVRELTNGVNPLYDFDPQRRWPIAVNLNTADTVNNSLTMRGGIQWVGFNRNRSDTNPPYQEPYNEPYREPYNEPYR